MIYYSLMYSCIILKYTPTFKNILYIEFYDTIYSLYPLYKFFILWVSIVMTIIITEVDVRCNTFRYTVYSNVSS